MEKLKEPVEPSAPVIEESHPPIETIHDILSDQGEINIEELREAVEDE